MSLHARLHAALLLGAFLCSIPPGQAQAVPSLPAPPQGRYCQPITYGDQRILIGFKAVVVPAPGCVHPSFVRKVNRVSGSVIGQPAVIALGTVESVWVFTHRLEYTLDGVHWSRLVIR